MGTAGPVEKAQVWSTCIRIKETLTWSKGKSSGIFLKRRIASSKGAVPNFQVFILMGSPNL